MNRHLRQNRLHRMTHPKHRQIRRLYPIPQTSISRPHPRSPLNTQCRRSRQMILLHRQIHPQAVTSRLRRPLHLHSILSLRSTPNPRTSRKLSRSQ